MTPTKGQLKFVEKIEFDLFLPFAKGDISPSVCLGKISDLADRYLHELKGRFKKSREAWVGFVVSRFRFYVISQCEASAADLIMALNSLLKTHDGLNVEKTEFMLTVARKLKHDDKDYSLKLIIDAHELLVSSKKSYVWQPGAPGDFCRKLAILEGIDLVPNQSTRDLKPTQSSAVRRSARL